jgi:acyl-CoA reductase-like NAD-dependent aldehyde dehydrogenase
MKSQHSDMNLALAVPDPGPWRGQPKREVMMRWAASHLRRHRDSNAETESMDMGMPASDIRTATHMASE